MKAIRRAWHWLTYEPQHRVGLRVLQVCLGVMLLYRLFTEAPFAAYLWGPHGIGKGSMRVVWGPIIGGFLDLPFSSMSGVWCVLALLGASAFCLITGHHTRWATLLALVTFSQIGSRLEPLGDGGDNICALTLFYMLLCMPAGMRPTKGSFAVFLHNVGFLAIGTQLAILYATSGMMKANGASWHNGTAMYLISQVETFSLPSGRFLFRNDVIETFATYSAMMYQIWFPVAILSPSRIPWLMVGIFFHLGVASFMGLVTFSSVMIGLECALISDREYRRAGALAARAWSTISKVVPFRGSRIIATPSELDHI